ncbi:MAG: ATP-binding protein, partial [Rhodospirillales bacterium]|nr:ATP-binding protein [Rhodospirillales bacterium]
DPAGDVALTSLTPQPLALNVSDRAYFSVHKDGQSALNFISPLIWGRFTGGFLFAVSRRVEDSSGALSAVVESSIDVRHFTDFYKRLQVYEDSALGIYKRDGSLVVRFPLPASENDTSAASRSVLFTRLIQESPEGIYVSNSVFDGVRRLAAYRGGSDGTLVFVAGTAMDAVLNDWRHRTLRNAAFAGSALMALLSLAVLTLRAAAQEEAARAGLEVALADKEVLFQEVHHRVKNNLQIISSLLTMQALQADNPAVREPLQEALDRIRSMGLVHQTLCRQGEAAEVSIATYLRSLADSLGESHGLSRHDITVDVTADACSLDLERAVPVALVANEALTNAIKHAFPGRTSGHISVVFRREEARFLLMVQDDGIGMPPDAGRCGSLGLHLLRSLAAQLGGQTRFEENGGTLFSLTFPV